MNYSDVVKHYGGVSQAAKQLSRTRPGIYYWRDNGIPYPTQLYIQELTHGKLKAKNGKRP
jgi:hypothetical protein